MAVPSGAGAATTVGETFTPTTVCFTNQTLLQTTSPGAQYAVPSDGVITRWSFQASAANVPTGLKFKVARPAGGNNFTVVGESTQVPPVASTLNNYFVQIPVRAGDLIGFYVVSPGNTRLCGINPVAGFAVHVIIGDVSPGTTAAFGPQVGPKLDVSALLEADCDKDGLGDETQDQNLSSCAPGTIPPPAPGAATATCRGIAATIVGTNGSDVRTGSQGQDVIAALGGNDTLSGLGGNDVICGGAGKDSLRGGKGKDSLLGQKGKDALNGGPSRDFCKGGKGNDTASKCEIEKSI
jgi:RTX calcium-binding nonapeptide repeat (4 copies)